MKMSEFMTSDSPYMSKETIWGTPVLVTIDRVEGNHDVPIPNSSKTSKKKVMFFEGKKLGLCINAGHRKFLRRLLGGKDTREWKGRHVLLYVEPTATYKGDEVGGIRMAIRTDRGIEWSGSEPRGKGPPAGAQVPRLDAHEQAAAPPPAAEQSRPTGAQVGPPQDEPPPPPDERQPGED